MIPSRLPNEYEEYQEYQPQQSTVEVVIGNILKGVVCVFLIVIGFFLVVMCVNMIDTQEAVEFRTYTDTFAISNPTLAQEVYVSNPLLSNIVVTKYNSSNASWGGVDSADWSYDTSWASITINASVLEHTITSLRVSATTNYAESQHLNVFTALTVALIISAIGSIFGIIAWNKYREQR